MQEVFKKIIMQLGIRAEKSEKKEMDAEHFEYAQMYKGERIAFGDAIEIVKQEAEKYNNGWIPCSERMPEENSNVIACFAHGLVTELTFYDGLFHGIYEYTTSVIIAWQPLPAPYQPKGE